MIFLVIGRREQGKTTLAYHMAAKSPQRVIFDPRGDIFRGERVTNSGDLAEAMAEMWANPAITDICYTPAGDSKAGFVLFSREIQQWVVRDKFRPLAVLVDELAFAELNNDHFRWVARCCSRNHLDVFITCHRPTDVDVDTRSIADHWLLFPCRQEHDLDVIRKRCNADVCEEVQALKPRQFVHWDDTKPDETDRWKIVRDHAQWFEDLRPPALGGPQVELPPPRRGHADFTGETPKKPLAPQGTLDL